jgi:hypothetical protein
MNDNIKAQLIKITEVQDKEKTEYFSFLRHLTTISIGFLGLLIGLKPEILPNEYSKILFLVTIVLLSLGVLFLTICLFHETIQSRKELKVRKKQLLEYVDSENTASVQIDNIGFGKLKIFEIITFSFLIASLLSLILYIYVLTFN